MIRYSLKKALMLETKKTKPELLTEGWFTDLASAVAIGGVGGVKEMIASKLQDFMQQTGEMKNSQALDMVQRFRKLGLKNLGGENLERIEKALQQQKTVLDKKSGKSEKKVGLDNLYKLLLGNKVKEATSYNNLTLKEVFQDD